MPGLGFSVPGLGWLAGSADNVAEADEIAAQALTEEEDKHLKRILGYDDDRKFEDEV